MNSRTTEESKEISSAFPHVTNMRTREDWLRAVIHGGHVTRVGQHLALVIYHLADTETNIAKLSARDLERITGWGRTAILKHLEELEKAFVEITWGQGRAKHIIELQGVIAEAMEKKKAERDAATTVDTTHSVHEVDAQTATIEATKVATNSSVHAAATQTATTHSVHHSGHRSVHEVDTNVQKSHLGGTIGGENNYHQDLSHSLTLTARERATPAAPDWMISEDGGFEGLVFELSGAEVGALQTTYSYLDFPADLVAVDQFLVRQFDRLGQRPSTKDCLARMHTYLAKRNREARAMGLSMGGVDKPERKAPAPSEPASCWFDNDARLQIANGFKSELLEAVGGDEIRLREELDKAAGWVGIGVRGPQLTAKVRSRVVEQVKGRGQGRAMEADAPSRSKQAWQLQVIQEALQEAGK